MYNEQLTTQFLSTYNHGKGISQGYYTMVLTSTLFGKI